jgi:serine/threonine protein kinase
MGLERGNSIGSYRVLFRLGSGGMGEVWKGQDTRSGREVAIKVLSPEAVQDSDRMRRFAMEANATSALDHPNILAVYEVGQSEAGPYIVTEYVDGETVRSLLMSGPLPLARALDIAAQTAEGVANAHGAGVIHRDLKPENLMVNREGLVKILDFGLAKLLRPGEFSGGIGLEGGLTAAGMVIGTAGYLSPEQLRGDRASERSDVFALGVVLYEMTTGENPFRRNNAVDTFTAIMRDEPPPLDPRLGPVPVELPLAIGKALAKKPEERYPSAREFAEDLRKIHSRLAPLPAEAEGVVSANANSRMPGILVAAIILLITGAFIFLKAC